MSCSMIDIVGSLYFWRSCRMISCLYTFVRGSIAYYPFAHKCDASTIIGPRKSTDIVWHCQYSFTRCLDQLAFNLKGDNSSHTCLLQVYEAGEDHLRLPPVLFGEEVFGH